MSEIIVLDPAEVTGDPDGELVITSNDPDSPFDIRISSATDGVDWGDLAIEAAMAELATVGTVPVDYSIPNRVIDTKLKIQATQDTTFAQARGKLQAKVAKLQDQGGWIKRELPGVGAVCADVVQAALKLPGDWMQAHRDLQMEAPLTLESLPDWWEMEWVQAGSISGSNGQAVGLLEGVRGAFPRGNRCRIVVDGDDTHDQLGVMWGVRRRHYSPVAALVYEAEALTPLDQATVETLSGASGGSVIRHNNLGTSWTPVCAIPAAEHTGSYRLWARVYTTSATPPQLRAIYGVGGGAVEELAPAQIPGTSNFYLVDLGEFRLDQAPVGPNRWDGQIQAQGAAGGENSHVDRIWLQPLDEGAGRLVDSPLAIPGLSLFAVRDEFNQTAGGLHGKSLAAAGNLAGPAMAGTGADDSGVGSVAWANPGNITTPGLDSYSQIGTLGSGVVSHYLKATNFGFTIPPGATIVGIQAEFMTTQIGECADERVRIVKGGTVQSTDRSKPGAAASWSSGAFLSRNYGGSSDLWGATWAYTDINASTFGVAIAVKGLITATPRVGSVRITVYYENAGGEAWATTGDATDFAVEATGHTVQRSEVSDADLNTGRYAAAGSVVLANTVVTAAITRSVLNVGSSQALRQAVLARYTDANNWLMGGILTSEAADAAFVAKRVSSTATVVATAPVAAIIGRRALWLHTDTSGRWWLWIAVAGGLPRLVLAGRDSVLATGGTLATGKVGIYDAKTGATAVTRNYDTFAGWAPARSGALLANSLLDISTAGAWRQTPNGTYAPIVPVGDHPRLPAGDVEVFVASSLGDFGLVPDAPLGDVDVEVLYRPCWLTAPDGDG